MRFEEKDDCYLDIKTGLEWSKDNFGPISWCDAMKNISKGWRLPVLEELLTLVDYKKYNPASALPGMISSNYWSSTTYAGYTTLSWSIGFYYGGSNWKNKADDDGYARAVRKVREVSDEI